MKSSHLLIIALIALISASFFPIEGMAQQLPAQQLPTNQFTQTPQSNVTLMNPDVILFSEGNFVLIQGYSKEVFISVINVGKDRVENIVLNVEPPTNETIFVEGPTQRQIEALEPGERKDISYKIISNLETEIKPYFLPISVSYLRRNREFSYSTGIGISILSSSPLFSIEVESDPLELGIGGEVILDVTNIGDFPAHNVYVTLKRGVTQQEQNETSNETAMMGLSIPETSSTQNVESMILGSASRYVGNLTPREKSSIVYDIVPGGDLKTGTYTYEAEISCYPSNSNKPIVYRYPIGFLFQGQPVVYLSSIEILNKGEEFVISGDANNIGSDVAKYVVIKSGENEFFAPAFSGSSYYVGTLEPDDFIPFEVGVLIKKQNPEPMDHEIKISYRDAQNRELMDTFVVTIPAQHILPEKKSGDRFGWIVLIVAILLIFAFVAFTLLRRKRV
jgi:hypothetical protein